MARQGHVFCLEIGRLCLFTQREGVPDMVGYTDCLIWEAVARSRAELWMHSIFYSDINQRQVNNKCQICCSCEADQTGWLQHRNAL